MRFLALDVGGRRTGVAFLDDATGIPLPLPSFAHRNQNELLLHVKSLCTGRRIDRVIVGLPLLPSGEEGKQAATSRAFSHMLKRQGMDVLLIDERYTTPVFRPGKHTIPLSSYDGDSAAACELLSGKIDY